MDVPRNCYQCGGDIRKAKAVLLACECLLAFCDDCARKQIFQTMKEKVVGISDVSVYCPSCKAYPIVPPPVNENDIVGNNLQKGSVEKAQAAVKEWVCFHPKKKAVQL